VWVNVDNDAFVVEHEALTDGEAVRIEVQCLDDVATAERRYRTNAQVRTAAVERIEAPVRCREGFRVVATIEDVEEHDLQRASSGSWAWHDGHLVPLAELPALRDDLAAAVDDDEVYLGELVADDEPLANPAPAAGGGAR